MNLNLALDVGHSSIGWAVLTEKSAQPAPPDLLGCGVVLFEKDSALASQRRLHRQQRRHVRATRTRIHRLEMLIAHLGGLTKDELAMRHAPGKGHPAPWQLAARVLASHGTTELSWSELWAVLRWYAHNRGYEAWGQTDESDPDAADDTEKVERAKEALRSLGTSTMAETVCRWLGVEPNGPAKLTHDAAKSLRQKKAAFPREIVRSEVRAILTRHVGHLPGIDDNFIRALMDDGRALPCPGLDLPRRYRGGLLFGRLQMRYDNRIIASCVHTAAALHAKLRQQGMPDVEARARAERGAKVPAKKSPEFLRYRWGMLLANLRIATLGDENLRPLNKAERERVHARMLEQGRFTKSELKETVRSLPGWERDDIENQFLVPESERALTLDPVQALIHGNPYLKSVWPTLPTKLQKRLRNRWWRVDPTSGNPHSTTLAKLREDLPNYDGNIAAFDAAIAAASTAPSKSKRRSRKSGTAADPLTAHLDIARQLSALKGRAPYARTLLAKAFEEVLDGLDPKAKGQCLDETETIKAYREGRPFDQQTNNHLLRHRLIILGRLLADLISSPTYGAGNAKRFTRATIEVNRELRDHSGLTVKEIAKDLGLRMKPHQDAVTWLETAGLQPTGSLIRKARVALDLNRTCPYTGEIFEAVHLRDGQVDLDHIIPRSMRPSDSLDSLAVTFPAVNRWKDKRTAWQFIQECGGESVPVEHLRATGETRQLAIMPQQRFEEFVASITPRKPRDGDSPAKFEEFRRQKRRADFFLMEEYSEKERDFTPGQLTQTSQLTRLARIATRRALPHLADRDIVALPGSVTGSVRKAWNLMSCLTTVSPAVLGPDGKLRPKNDIRGITHLHHAVDAITLGYASALLPNNGALWTLLSQRKVAANQRELFRSLAPVEIAPDGRWQLRELLKHHPAIDQRIRACLAERRVVQHVPADMSGIRLEQNTWRVERVRENRVHLRQKAPRNPKGTRDDSPKRDEIEAAKAFGLTHGRLHQVKGVRVLDGNFAVAVLTASDVSEEERIQIVRHNRVWTTLRDLKKRNGGRAPILLRAGAIIEVPTGSRKGRWRIVSPKKSEAYGISLDLAALDGIKLAKGNAPVAALLQDGMRLLKTGYAGCVTG